MAVLMVFICFFISTHFVHSERSCDMEKFKTFVPKTIPEIPKEELKVLYPDTPIICGAHINISLTENAPMVNYSAVNVDFYALIMIDPDAPDPYKPVFANFLHWFVVNIPGTKIENGKVLKDYMEPYPPPYSMAHRYLLLVFHQPSYIFSPNYMLTRKRSRFDVNHMMKEMNMRSIVAGNFFYTGFN